MLHVKFGFDWPRFSEKNFENGGRRIMAISSPCKPNGSGELKIMPKNFE